MIGNGQTLRSLSILLGVLVSPLWGEPAVAVGDPAASGPFSAVRETVAIPGMAGASLTTDVFYPGAGGAVEPGAVPCPVVVLGHGFLQDRENHRNQGLHFASRGFIVLIPSFNAPSDHGRNADELLKCLDWIEEQDGDPTSRFFEAVARDRFGASGHSAGGLSALVAASRDPRIRAVAPMDPVDSGGLGAAAVGTIGAPLLVLHSEPSACNANGSAEVLYAQAGGPRTRVRIVGANHSDPQDPGNFLGSLLCGFPEPARQARYRRYVTAWMEFHLRDDARYAGWVRPLPGGALAADRDAGLVSHDEWAAPFLAWQAARFGPAVSDPEVADPGADPDGDGIANLLEFAFNLDPWTPDPGGLPRAQVVEIGAQRHLAIEFRRVAGSGLIYQVEFSEDGLVWAGGSGYADALEFPETAPTVEVSRSGLGLQTLVVRSRQALAAAERGLLRIKVTQP